MGLIHVFLFLNVKDGPSRFRMASFYAVWHELKLLFFNFSSFFFSCVFIMLFCAALSHLPTHRAAGTNRYRYISLQCHPHLCVLSPQWRKAVYRWLMVPPSLLLQFMLVENATLLLAASDFLSEASWDSMTLPTTVLCGFLLGESFVSREFAVCIGTLVIVTLMSHCLLVSVISKWQIPSCLFTNS